ncbi:uncharacterized protein [Populus alba]|uniref:uncharacterized protein isoform X1 n=1 Tax=Populus alba TaxID=43335 RepID=UPI003CC74608
MAPSPSSTRKSERLENRTPTTPAVMRKSGSVEKQSMSSLLRRSKRGKNQSSTSSFGSKKSGKSLGSSVMKKKHRKEKSVKLLTLETNEIGHSEKHIIKAVQVETKITDARVYRSLFKQQQKKANLEGFCEETKNKKAKSSQGYCSNLRAGASENIDGGGDCSQREVDELIEECILKDSEKKMLGNSVLSAGGSPEFDNNHLDFVNYLLECWHRGENAVLIDDQEQIAKVIYFILSISSNATWPFLIITTSAALHSWEEGLFRLAPSLYAVVYHGNKDIRKSIRTLEFYSEGGCIMFQILITSPEVIIEDLNMLESMKWEAIIVDECQRSRIYSHFKQIKLLSTAMRLLLVNGQLKVGITEHLLSLLVHQSDPDGSECLVIDSSHKTGIFKERLSQYIANGCKPDSSRLKEYWVPVQLSIMQLEQYCAILLSNSLLLCSSSKNDLAGSLHDILISVRKCCDHPYIMDPSLQISLTKDSKEADILDIGIKASGKLQLLDAMLFNIKERGLRVLVLFQSSGGSGKDNVGDILDDFISQRFGKGCYERVDGHVLPSRKQAALKNFNNLQEGRFVFLLETRACSPSIKLSSVDTVIIFASDWKPHTDIRNLQKITLYSESEQINIFRLYSSCTVEERVLIVARQDKTLDRNLQRINQGACHMLLMWGVSYLFDKLSEFNCGNDPASSGNMLFEQSHMKDVMQEFLTIVTQKGKDKNLINSIILNVKQNQGSYTTNLPLHGEPKIQLLDEELPHVFWERLLKGKQPQWKYSSGLFQRNRKRVQYFDDIQKNPEVKADEVVKKRKKVAIDNSNSPSLKAAPIGTSGAPVCSMAQFMPSSTGCLTTTDANHVSNFTHLNNKLSLLPKANAVDYNERMNLHYSRKSLHLVLKPEIEKLSEILQLPEDVKVMVDQFLEYVLNNHHVSREPASILQAFLISLCWTAASMIKYKLDRKESLALAKQHLNFRCTKDEADFVYSKLRYLKKVFLYHTGNFKLAGSPKAAEFSTKDLSTNQSNGRPSPSTQSNMQKVRIEVENLRPSQEFFFDQALSHLGLTQKDYSENIEEKCDEQMNKLLQRQREEREELKKKYEEEKAELELIQRTEAAVIHLHSNSSMRTDKLKVLDNVFAKEFRELKRKMEIRLNNVLEFQLATRNKLQERKVHWIGVKLSGLLNKPLANESRYDQQNAATLNSCSKEQTSERAQSMPDGEVLLEALETVSLNEDVFSGVLSASEPMLDGASSSMLDREVPLEMPQTASVSNVSENIVYLNASSGEGQIPVTQVAVRVLEAISSSDGPENTIHKSSSESPNRDALMVPDSEFPLGVTEIVSSTGGLENAASANPSPSEGCTARTTSCMDGREVLLDVPETASLEAEHGNRVMEKDGKSAMVSDNATEEDQQNGLVSMLNQDSQSDNIIAVNQQNGEVLLGVPQTNEVGLQDEEVPSGVHGTPVEGSASNGGENTGVYVTAFSNGTGVDQLAGVLPSGGFETATSAELEGSRTQREIDSIHAVASDTSHPAESSRLQDGVAQVCDNQIAFQQVDASASQPLVVASGQSPNDALVTEHLLELLLSTGSPTPSDSHPATSFAQLSPIDSIAVGGSGMHISNMRAAPVTPGISNRPGTTLAVRMPVSMSQEPLQNELDRLSKETEEIIKIHEDTVCFLFSKLYFGAQKCLGFLLLYEKSFSILQKLQLKSDCEKEIVEVIAQIHKKHDIKLQEIESDFQCKKKEMNDNQNKVLMNKILAEAFKTKCMDSRASSTLGKQQEITSSAVQQLLRQSQPTAQRPPIVASSGVSADGHQTSPSLSPPSPPLEVVRCSSLLSGTPTRPPHIGSISAITNNLQLGSGIRAPAPHLQPFRPSASISTTGLSSFLHGMQSQQVPSTFPTLSEIPSRAPASVQQSGPQTTTNCCESMGASPSSTHLPGLDSLMDVGYQTIATQPCSFPPVTNLISNPNQLTQPELSMLHSVNSVLTNPASEVCISDDD